MLFSEAFDLKASFKFQAFLVAQMVKNLLAMWEIWVQSLGGEDPLEKETITHSSIFAWRIPWTEELGVHGVAKSWTRLSDFTFFLWDHHLHKLLTLKSVSPSLLLEEPNLK